MKGRLQWGVGIGSCGEEAAASLQWSEGQLGCELAQGCPWYMEEEGQKWGWVAGPAVLTAL